MLRDNFVRVLHGVALLPRIRALGDDDDEEFLFDPASENIDLLPAIDPVRRRLLLAVLVRRWAQLRRQVSPGFARAAAMAASLARFFDEVQTQQSDLECLRELAPESLAAHWSDVCDFLVFLHTEWPRILEAEGALDPAERRNRLLSDLARRFRDERSRSPVIAAGTTGSIPATAELLSTIATLPMGAIVLPALDRELDVDSWSALEPGHAQYGMKQLLDRVGATRNEVEDWQQDTRSSTARAFCLRQALRPAPTTDAWREIVQTRSRILCEGLEGISLIEAAHPGEEALAIALMLREVAQAEEKTAALVTPDRGLARRVAAELQRWDIAIDDSAGVPLGQTPPGVFLALLAEAAVESFAPVPLLALLKHPFSAGSETAGGFRRRARLLDRLALRGPRPDPGLAGVLKAIENARVEKAETGLAPMLAELAEWFARVAESLRPFADAMTSPTASLSTLVKLHCEAAEQLAANAEAGGTNRLWRGADGEAAAESDGIACPGRRRFSRDRAELLSPSAAPIR